MGVKGARLSAIAQCWALDIEQEVELVASILFRYARGDYLENEVIPGLRSLLAGPEGPISPEKPTFDEVFTEDGRHFMVKIQIPGADSFIERDILETLKTQDPHIDYVGLRLFLANQGIAAPLWMDPMARPDAADKPIQNVIRKQKTQERYAAWQAEIDRLSCQHEQLRHADLAKRVARTPIANGRSWKTIQNNTALNKSS